MNGRNERNKDNPFASSKCPACLQKKSQNEKKKKLRQIFCLLAAFTFEVMVRQTSSFFGEKSNQSIDYACYWSNDHSAYRYIEAIKT